MSAVTIRPAGMRPANQVFGITKVCEKILASLPPKEIVPFTHVSKCFRDIIRWSFDVRKAALGGRLPRLLHCYHDLNMILATTDNNAELIIIDEIIPLGSFNRSRGVMRVGISLMVHFPLAHRSTQPNGNSRTRYFPVLAKYGLSPNQLEEKNQNAIRLELDSAFPSSCIPEDLEIAGLTHRQLKGGEGSLRLAVYRVRVSLHPAPFGSLFHIINAIKEAVGMPHRRKDGKLDLSAGRFGRMGLCKEHFALLKDSPACIEEHWRI